MNLSELDLLKAGAREDDGRTEVKQLGLSSGLSSFAYPMLYGFASSCFLEDFVVAFTGPFKRIITRTHKPGAFVKSS